MIFGQTVNAAKGFNRYRPLVVDNCRRQWPKPPVTYDKLQVMPRASVHPCVARPLKVATCDDFNSFQTGFWFPIKKTRDQRYPRAN